jgi:hypothetical protein
MISPQSPATGLGYYCETLTWRPSQCQILQILVSMLHSHPPMLSEMPGLQAQDSRSLTLMQI